jgi:hypothetical protein
MNAQGLIKLAPTLILVGFLGYSLYSMQSAIPEAAELRTEMQKDFDRLVQEVVTESSTAAVKLEGKLRDPFWVATAPATRESAPKEETVAGAQDDLAGIVKGMTLDATFLQGKDQLAIIDGRIYSRGQRIAIPGDDAAQVRSMLVVAVNRTGVLLKGGDKHYKLNYPDELGKKKGEDGKSEAGKERAMAEIDPSGQMEMFQRLLNSPLGAMGRGLIGDAVGKSPGASKKARGRAAPGSRTPVSGAGAP